MSPSLCFAQHHRRYNAPGLLVLPSPPSVGAFYFNTMIGADTAIHLLFPYCVAISKGVVRQKRHANIALHRQLPRLPFRHFCITFFAGIRSGACFHFLPVSCLRGVGGPTTLILRLVLFLLAWSGSFIDCLLLRGLCFFLSLCFIRNGIICIPCSYLPFFAAFDQSYFSFFAIILRAFFVFLFGVRGFAPPESRFGPCSFMCRWCLWKYFLLYVCLSSVTCCPPFASDFFVSSNHSLHIFNFLTRIATVFYTGLIFLPCTPQTTPDDGV